MICIFRIKEHNYRIWYQVYILHSGGQEVSPFFINLLSINQTFASPSTEFDNGINFKKFVKKTMYKCFRRFHSRAIGMSLEIGLRKVLPTEFRTSTVCTRSSVLLESLSTLSSLQTPLGKLSSISITTPPSFRFSNSTHHFLLGPSIGITSC